MKNDRKITRPARTESFWDRHRNLMTVFVGLLGAVLALVGAGIGANAALGGVEKQIAAGVIARSQDKRDVAYKGYLEAANKYFYSWDELSRANEDKAKADAEVRFRLARFEFQGQANEVWVQGSDSAIKGLIEMSAVLPESLASSELPPHERIPDQVLFREKYNNFLRIRCEETAPVTRTGCRP
ncbi:hypothetical protein ACFFGR_05860 [Arthrobacter liuii]|uniref:Uncharacterized protein n=1 Tax=Arthrobacter liuii TaxID=1476996 RepID=A0ABQ2B0W9_9MICC|nr:hypothetical protein [Arthrobacter liuii]GGI00614.1 hypothetical protein GCM10007170_38170 [Arthrobacter liuii]